MSNIELGEMTRLPEVAQFYGQRDPNGIPRMRDIGWTDIVQENQFIGQMLTLNGEEWLIAVIGFQEAIGPFAGVRDHLEGQLEVVFSVYGYGRMDISPDGTSENSMRRFLAGPFSREQAHLAKYSLSKTSPSNHREEAEQLILKASIGRRSWDIPGVVTPMKSRHRTFASPTLGLGYAVVKMEQRVEVAEKIVDFKTISVDREHDQVTAKTTTGRPVKFWANIPTYAVRMPSFRDLPKEGKVYLDGNTYVTPELEVQNFQEQASRIEIAGGIACSNFTYTGVWVVDRK